MIMTIEIIVGDCFSELSVDLLESIVGKLLVVLKAPSGCGKIRQMWKIVVQFLEAAVFFFGNAADETVFAAPFPRSLSAEHRTLGAVVQRKRGQTPVICDSASLHGGF